MKCRNCSHQVNTKFIDLNSSPPSNSYLKFNELNGPELWFPLRVLVCENCWLVQTEDFTDASTLFDSEYAYFSSFSSTWLSHSKEYFINICSRFNINSSSNVIEVASNDGYLLQFFKNNNIPCLGIEPTKSTASEARRKGIEIIEEFFCENLAIKLNREGKQADLMIANNVLAHVPQINDFVKSFFILLKDDGILTFEFPHLDNLINHNQFDTIYHEHFSYLSLFVVKSICEKNDLQVFDVEKIPTHGGSLRVYVQKCKTGQQTISSNVNKVLSEELFKGINSLNYYLHFQNKIELIKYQFIEFLLKVKQENKSVIGYGAAAKGNTLLNFSGIKSDLISFIIDQNPSKGGKYSPGSRIPIYSDEGRIREFKPNFIMIFPWNLKEEIMNQLSYVREWNGKFVIAIPELKIL
jgi:hypothetical protein